MKAKILSSFLLSAGFVPGAVIVWSEQDIPIPGSLEGVYLDLVTGETHDSESTGFSAAQVNFFFGGLGIITSEDFLPARSGNGNLDPIVALGLGDMVDGNLNYSPPQRGGSTTHLSDTPGPDQFGAGTPGYLGFQLDANQDDQFVFGWMRVTLTNGGGVATIHEWAYNTVPGEGLRVGAIPEPSAIMILLTGGSLGFGFFRRRHHA